VTPPICRSSSDSVEIIPSLDSEHQGATDRKGIVAYQRLHEGPKARITFRRIDCSGRPRYFGFEIDRGMSAPRAGRCHGAFPSTVANRDGARLRGTLVARFSTGEAPLERRQMNAERLFQSQELWQLACSWVYTVSGKALRVAAAGQVAAQVDCCDGAPKLSDECSELPIYWWTMAPVVLVLNFSAAFPPPLGRLWQVCPTYAVSQCFDASTAS
jgi:hypothetical protein